MNNNSFLHKKKDTKKKRIYKKTKCKFFHFPPKRLMSVSQNDPKMKTLGLATKQEILALITSSSTLEEIALQVEISKSTKVNCF